MMSLTPEPVGLSDAEVEFIDRWMGDHMRGHAISNSVNGMSCSMQCRQRAIKMAVDKVLVARVGAV